MNLLSVHEASHAIAAHHLVGANLGFIHRDGDGGFLVRNDIEHKRITKREMVGMMVAGILGEQIFAWVLKKRAVPLQSGTVGARLWQLYLAAGAKAFVDTPHGESDAEQIIEWLTEGFITESELGEIINDLAPALFKSFKGIDFDAMNRELQALEGNDYIELDFSEELVTWEPVAYVDLEAIAV